MQHYELREEENAHNMSIKQGDKKSNIFALCNLLTNPLNSYTHKKMLEVTIFFSMTLLLMYTIYYLYTILLLQDDYLVKAITVLSIFSHIKSKLISFKILKILHHLL